MDETGDALRSCMEQLLLVRDEKERLVIEATDKISSEQKKTLHLQQKFEDANKQFEKVITENYSLCSTVASKEKLIKELKESKAESDQKLTDATIRLEFSQKQCASLRYEVRMLQEELEIRSKEREYDLKSIDAARKRQQESAKKITALEAECQRLRTMVQKRLPGPAALAKMKDEVKRQGSSSAENGTRRPRAGAAVQPQQARHSMPEGHLVKLQELGDENIQLRQLLAQKESDLHFVLSKYADEACKLSVLRRQNEELSGSHGKPMVSAFAKPGNSISEKQQVSNIRSRSRRITRSDMQLLVDPLDFEKPEWASRPSSAPHHCLDSPDTDSKMTVSDIFHREHQDSKICANVILDEVTHALKNEISAKGEVGAHYSYDRKEIEKMVTTLTERVSNMAERSTKNNVMSFRSLSHETSELTLRLEHLVHVCSDVLDGKANLERLSDEICLILEWIVSRCLLCSDGLEVVDYITNNSDGNESQRALSIHEKDISQSTKSKIVLGTQQERQISVETTEDLIPDVILENYSQIELITSKLVEDLVALRQEQGDSWQEQHLICYEAKSAACDGSKEQLAEEEGNQLTTTSAISAAARKLAECQETMANLSKQLYALESPANTDPSSDKEKCGILPRSAEPVATEKEELGDIDANATEKKEHKQDSRRSPQSAKSAPTMVIVRPMIPKSPRPSVSVDTKKKKRRANLLGRLVFRKKA